MLHFLAMSKGQTASLIMKVMMRGALKYTVSTLFPTDDEAAKIMQNIIIEASAPLIISELQSNVGKLITGHEEEGLSKEKVISKFIEETIRNTLFNVLIFECTGLKEGIDGCITYSTSCLYNLMPHSKEGKNALQTLLTACTFTVYSRYNYPKDLTESPKTLAEAASDTTQKDTKSPGYFSQTTGKLIAVCGAMTPFFMKGNFREILYNDLKTLAVSSLPTKSVVDTTLRDFVLGKISYHPKITTVSEEAAQSVSNYIDSHVSRASEMGELLEMMP